MNDKDKLHENLINLLKLFKNRPHHLSKYLIDNNALSDSFSKKLINSKIERIQFSQIKDISELTDYFNSVIEPILIEGKTLKELSIELSDKLSELISEEKYEEAILIRDYMSINNIPKI